jgi:Polyketide cyclase / dehydrase and lipid transport
MDASLSGDPRVQGVDDGVVAIAMETTEIDFAIADVFAFLADGANNILWRPDVAKVSLAEGPPETAVWAQSVLDAKGRERNSDYRVSWYDRPGRLELTVVAGSPRPTTIFQLRSLSPRETRVTCTVEVRPRWWPLASRTIGVAAAKAEAANIHNLGAGMYAAQGRRV